MLAKLNSSLFCTEVFGQPRRNGELKTNVQKLNLGNFLTKGLLRHYRVGKRLKLFELFIDS